MLSTTPHHNKIVKKELDELISLRKKGWTYESLAFLYGVDHSSIYHLCKKYGAEPGTHRISFDFPAVIEAVNPQVDVISILESVRRKPVCYADYLLSIK